MILDHKPITFDKVARLALGAAVAWGAVWLLGYLSSVLVPFAVALLLAYLLNPAVRRVQRLVRHRGLAVGLTLVGLALALAVVVAVVAPVVAGEVQRMARIVQDIMDNSQFAQRVGEWLPANLWEWIKEQLQRPEVERLVSDASTLEALRKMIPGVWGVIAGTASALLGLVGLFFVLLYLIFLLMDYQHLESWLNLVPQEYREKVGDFAGEFQDAMSRYFRGQSAVAGIVGVLCALGFWAIGLPMGILLGLFVGLLNMVPYMQNIAIPIAALLALLHAVDVGMNPWLMLGLTGGVFAVVQVIQDGFLVPRIMGGVMSLSPWVILLSLSVWGKLLGLLGLLLALPLTFLLLAYYRRFLAKHGQQLQQQREQGEG